MVAGGALCFGALAGAGEPPLEITQVADVNESGDSDPNSVTEAAGTVFFTAERSAAEGRELWRTDGTPTGTDLVKDLTPDELFSSDPTNLTPYAGALYFSASSGAAGVGRELYKSDGTEDGTTLVKNINPGEPGVSSSPDHFVVAGGTLYFLANSNHPDDFDLELWRSDGSGPGTTKVADLPAGASDVSALVNVGARVYFSVKDGNGRELWTSDGTEAETERVRDINPGPGDGLVDLNPTLAPFAGEVYFRATNGNDGVELWKSDGSSGGTDIVKDINPAGDGMEFSTVFEQFEGELYFGAGIGAGLGLWKTDGSEEGTVQVKGGLSVEDIAAGDDRLYLFTLGNELWKSDGTEAGTELIEAFGGFGVEHQLTDFSGALFFRADDGVNGVELWRSDGTAEGTEIAGQLVDGAGGSLSINLTPIGTSLYFNGDDGESGVELWRARLDLPECSGREPTMAGTDGDNTLSGTPGTDVIVGLDGADKIKGAAGTDFICGGGGADRLNGGGGAGDKVTGQAGKDRLSGGGGRRDRCNGGAGRDRAGRSCEFLKRVP